MTIAVIGGLIIVSMAYAQDAHTTVNLVVAVISIRGLTWVVKKITSSLNVHSGEIINMAGWCIAGVSIVKILNLAKMQVDPLLSRLGEMSNSMGGAGNLADKLTFWN